MGVKKSAVCKSRPPPNGMNPASSRVSIPLTKPSDDPGASPLSACSRSPGANLEAQPALVEYFVSLMRVRSSIGQSIPLRRYTACWRESRSKQLGLSTDVAGRRPPCGRYSPKAGPVARGLYTFHELWRELGTLAEGLAPRLLSIPEILSRSHERKRPWIREWLCSEKENIHMAQCEICGNDYDKAFQVSMPGARCAPSTASSVRSTP